MPRPADNQAPGGPGAGILLAPPVLLLLAAVLLLEPLRFSSPVAPWSPPPAWAADPAPVLGPRLVPEIEVAGYTYRCSDCHRFFSSPEETDRPLTQHREIELNHGINTRCFNCHNREDRDFLADDRGGSIPFDRPPLLCAKCHGPVYRDWLHGSHGRSEGWWDAARGPMLRRRCIECHDPHRPPFPAMAPAPGPRALRQGEPAAGEAGVDKNPLRVYKRQAPAGRAEEGRE